MDPTEEIRRTLPPILVELQRLAEASKWRGGAADIISFAQGMVHWPPPPEAMRRARAALEEEETAHYGKAQGRDDLIAEIKMQVVERSIGTSGEEEGVNLTDPLVMVTSGANQAYFQCVCATMLKDDATERRREAVLFAPYYYNHHMALSSNGVPTRTLPRIAEGPLRGTPDLHALKREISRNPNIKLVTVCNPDNPTGSIVPNGELEEISRFCARSGVRLLVDNTYQDFRYGDHHSPQDGRMEAENVGKVLIRGKHVVNIFSFSKAFGMMGYRVGYLVVDDEELYESLLKVQDAITICPPVLSQIIALESLKADAARSYVKNNVQDLLDNQRRAVRAALLEFFDEKNLWGASSIYFFVKLECKLGDKRVIEDDFEFCRRMMDENGIEVLPGSACGENGWIRICFANLSMDKCEKGLERLKQGLRREFLD